MENVHKISGKYSCRCVVLTAVLLSLLLTVTAGCGGGAEPPFETDTYKQRAEEADEAFGWYIHQPKGIESVRIHRIELPGEWNRGFEELPVDVYYPPEFGFEKRDPAVFVIAGSTKWSASISLAGMLAAEGTIAVVLQSQAAGEKVGKAIEGVLEQADELFIDMERLAMWSEGHSVPPALGTMLDETYPHHSSFCCAVFVSPKMYIDNDKPLQYEEEEMTGDVPIFIAKAANDDFYEINASVKMFREAAERFGLEVTYRESPVGGHNWMVEEQDEAAVEVIREAVEFLEGKL
jgi:predicted esterase